MFMQFVQEGRFFTDAELAERDEWFHLDASMRAAFMYAPLAEDVEQAHAAEIEAIKKDARYVYAVMQNTEYEGQCIVDVYQDRSKADDHMNTLNAPRSMFTEYTVEEWEILK